eukprot:2386464-Ditylum_brightwellii.AAC.1
MTHFTNLFAGWGTTKRPKNGGISSAIESNGISSVLVGALTNNNNSSQGKEEGRWDIGIVNQVISEDFAFLDWNIVARYFDFPGLMILDGKHLMATLCLTTMEPSLICP